MDAEQAHSNFLANATVDELDAIDALCFHSVKAPSPDGFYGTYPILRDKETALYSLIQHNRQIQYHLKEFLSMCDFSNIEWSMKSERVFINASDWYDKMMNDRGMISYYEEADNIEWRKTEWYSLGHDEVDGFFTRFTYHEQFL